MSFDSSMFENSLLISPSGVNYCLLRDLLEAGNWQAADLETMALMLKVAGREREGWFNEDCLKNFPAKDLKLIDSLWLNYSGFRFGFSVQLRFYLELGKDFKKLGDCVGWRVDDRWLSYGERCFDISAPVGHLPSGGVGYQRWERTVELTYAALAERLLKGQNF